MVLANLPYVTDSTIFDRSPEIRREPRIAVTGDCGEDGLGVIRGLIAETPSRLADGARARHPPRPGDAGDAARGDYHARPHGRRAGNSRPRALSAERAAAMSDAPPRLRRRARPRRERLAKVERLRAEGIDPFPRSFRDRTRIAAIHGRARPRGARRGRARRVHLPDRRPADRAARPRQERPSSTSATSPGRSRPTPASTRSGRRPTRGSRSSTSATWSGSRATST